VAALIARAADKGNVTSLQEAHNTWEGGTCFRNVYMREWGEHAYTHTLQRGKVWVMTPSLVSSQRTTKGPPLLEAAVQGWVTSRGREKQTFPRGRLHNEVMLRQRVRSVLSPEGRKKRVQTTCPDDSRGRTRQKHGRARADAKSKTSGKLTEERRGGAHPRQRWKAIKETAREYPPEPRLEKPSRKFSKMGLCHQRR